MRYLDEQEAWYMIAAMIKGTDMLSNDPIHVTAGGLCTVVTRMRNAGAVSTPTARKMVNRAMQAVAKCPSSDGVYLTTRCNWKNGIRLEYALKFAEECAPKSKR